MKIVAGYPPDSVFETHQQIMYGPDTEARLRLLGVPMRRYVWRFADERSWATFIPKWAHKLSQEWLEVWSIPIYEEDAWSVEADEAIKNVVLYLTLTEDASFVDTVSTVLRLEGIYSVATMAKEAVARATKEARPRR